jgi:hypothetical protein
MHVSDSPQTTIAHADGAHKTPHTHTHTHTHTHAHTHTHTRYHQAYADGAEYFYMVNDDLLLLTHGWADRFVSALENRFIECVLL